MFSKLLRFHLLLFSFLFMLGMYADVCHAKKVGELDFGLTKEEWSWLKAHPKIRIGVDANYTPYSFRDTDGKYRGIAMEFINYFRDNLGVSWANY